MGESGAGYRGEKNAMNFYMDHTVFLHIHIDSILIWGFVATVVLTTMMNVSQWVGYSRMSLPFMLGTVFTGNRDHAQFIGFGCHFVLGWVLTCFYALAFENLRRSGWWLGAVFGLGHGLFILASIMPLIEHVHPRMASEHYGPSPTRMLEPPGFMGLNYGRRTPLTAIAAHVTFGMILGAFYRLTG